MVGLRWPPEEDSLSDSQDPGFAPEAGGGLRQREIQGFRVDSEKRSGKVCAAWRGGDRVSWWHPKK